MRTCRDVRTCFSAKAKDVLPNISKSYVVYEYRRRCERAYIGKTTQCLSERAKQHIPNTLLETPPVLWSAKMDSAISKHQKENPECISEVIRKSFSVLAQARSQAHLNVLEALFIQAKSPVLCSPKDFVRVLLLF